MNLKDMLPKTEISEETLLLLRPVLEGESLFKQQKFSEAREKYREALANFTPGSGGRFLVYNKLGIVCEKLENLDEAMEAYEQAIAEGSTTPFSYQRMALLHMSTGRFHKAREYCSLGIKSLKRANTNLFEELYFWVGFKKIQLKIKRLLPT